MGRACRASTANAWPDRSEMLAAVTQPAPEILLVISDDDEAVMYTYGLERAGFRVSRSRGTPREPVTADVAVVDDIEAGGPGWAAIASLRAGPPVVVLTAHVRPDRAVRDRVAALHCAAYVAKPCTPATLAAILNRVLAGERGIEEVAPE